MAVSKQAGGRFLGNSWQVLGNTSVLSTSSGPYVNISLGETGGTIDMS